MDNEALNTRSSSTHSDAEHSEAAHQQVGSSKMETTTPQGEWVDLTDDEVEAVAKSNDTWQLFQSLRIFDFSNALMAKFKEKNGGGA